jgi:hypothetical protein
MRLVTVLLGALTVCLVAFVFSVYVFARSGSATPAFRPVPSLNPAAGSPAVVTGPAPTAPPQLVAAPPDSAGAGSGPVAIAPQSEPSTVSGQPAATAAPAADENPKHHRRGHDKHGGGGGGGG